MNLSTLDVFSEVMRAGSFSTVARQRKVSPSAISRTIAALEAELDVLLFYRTTRRIAPTEAAVLLSEQAAPHLDALQSIRTTISEAGERPTGVLRVSASHSFGAICLGPLIPDFRAAFPNIKLELSLTDRIVDIVGESMDLAIRHGPLPDSSMVAKPILSTRYHACASPEYLARTFRPKKVQQISDMDCLTFPLPGFEKIWRFKNSKGRVTDVPVQGVMTANSGQVLRECALRGDGVILQSDWIIGEDLASGRLVDLFPSHVATPTNFRTSISAVYPDRKHTPVKVAVFVDWLATNLELSIHGSKKASQNTRR